MHVVDPGRYTYVIDETVFTDDPMLTEAVKRRDHAGGAWCRHPDQDAGGFAATSRSALASPSTRAANPGTRDRDRWLV